ncbi:chitinase [Streptomyces sp. M19]
MSQTGIDQFTLAFILSDGGCNPAWDGQRPLTGGQDEELVNSIKGAGGDITVSVGGWSGNKLGEACSSAEDLAGAYQKIIDAYGLKSLDIDIESTEVENETVRQRVVDALKIVQDNNSDTKIYVTFGTTTEGPNENGTDLINKGAAAGLDAVWTVMPFDFGDASTDMAASTESAVDGLKDDVKAAYGLSDDEAYAKSGLSSMNGTTDTSEVVTLDNWKSIVDYAGSHHLGRVSFWSLNRDKAGSGTDQGDLDFTKVLAGYQG